MKILILSNCSGGIYKFRFKLIKELQKKNDVVIAVPDSGFYDTLRKYGLRLINVPIDRRGINPINDLKQFFQYMKITKETHPDLVISYTVKPNIYGGLACRVTKTSFVANVTGLGSAIEGGGILQKLVFAMYKAGLKKAKVVFFENEGNRDVMVKAGVVKREKTYVLNGAGIDTEEYPLMPYPSKKPIHFLFVGRIMKEKGVDELFEAITRLKSEYGENVILDVVGMFEESYQQRIEKLQNDDIIVFHGYQQDVKPFYETAHCVVLPSYHEGMSNVLLEAASCGRPIITSNICGCREAVDDGVSGFLCEAKNTESLYNAMKHFVELTREERIKFGLAGRERMEKIFDKREVVKKTIEVLDL